MAAYIVQSKGTQTAAAAMSAELELAAFKWVECEDNLTAAQQQANQLQFAAAQAKQAASDALKSLKELQAHAAKETAANGSVSLELQKKLMPPPPYVKRLTLKQVVRKTKATNLLLTPLIRLSPRRIAAVQTWMPCVQKLVALFNALTQQQGALERKQQKENEGKSLTYLLAVINKLIGKSASEKLEASAELNKKLSATSIKDEQENAKEFAAKQAKAEEMQKPWVA